MNHFIESLLHGIRFSKHITNYDYVKGIQNLFCSLVCYISTVNLDLNVKKTAFFSNYGALSIGVQIAEKWLISLQNLWVLYQEWV